MIELVSNINFAKSPNKFLKIINYFKENLSEYLFEEFVVKLKRQLGREGFALNDFIIKKDNKEQIIIKSRDSLKVSSFLWSICNSNIPIIKDILEVIREYTYFDFDSEEDNPIAISFELPKSLQNIVFSYLEKNSLTINKVGTKIEKCLNDIWINMLNEHIDNLKKEQNYLPTKKIAKIVGICYFNLNEEEAQKYVAFDFDNQAFVNFKNNK